MFYSTNTYQQQNHQIQNEKEKKQQNSSSSFLFLDLQQKFNQYENSSSSLPITPTFLKKKTSSFKSKSTSKRNDPASDAYRQRIYYHIKFKHDILSYSKEQLIDLYRSLYLKYTLSPKRPTHYTNDNVSRSILRRLFVDRSREFCDEIIKVLDIPYTFDQITNKHYRSTDKKRRTIISSSSTSSSLSSTTQKKEKKIPRSSKSSSSSSLLLSDDLSLLTLSPSSSLSSTKDITKRKRRPYKKRKTLSTTTNTTQSLSSNNQHQQHQNNNLSAIQYHQDLLKQRKRESDKEQRTIKQLQEMFNYIPPKFSRLNPSFGIEFSSTDLNLELELNLF